MNPRGKASTCAKRSPREASLSKQNPARPSVPAIRQSRGLPKALTQACIVAMSRGLGLAGKSGCVCRKPMMSRRFSSRVRTATPSNSTRVESPTVRRSLRPHHMRPRRSPTRGQHSSQAAGTPRRTFPTARAFAADRGFRFSGFVVDGRPNTDSPAFPRRRFGALRPPPHAARRRGSSNQTFDLPH